MMKWVNELGVVDKRVFVRVDYNVPVDESGRPTDDSRIVASLETVRYLIENKARVILASHLGRPEGNPHPRYSLVGVAERLAELLNRDVLFPEDCVGDAARKLSHDLKGGDVLLLENLRFHPEEETCDPLFSERLAVLAEVYVNDAFGTLHRAHASTVGMVKKFSERGGGFLVKKETAALARLLHPEAHPFVAVVGGAKTADKLPLLESLIGRVDTFLLGGALALTFLAARGVKLGRSKIETERFHMAHRFLERAASHRVQVILPVDHVASGPEEEEGPAEVVTNESFPEGKAALDIGPKTRDLFKAELATAKVVFWNGPLGFFERPPFDEGTRVVAEAVAASPAFTVVGGGDSLAALHRVGLAHRVGHLSTGGGASLEFIQGITLPGLAALE